MAFFISALTAIGLSGCKSTSYDEVKDPKGLLTSLAPSGLVVLPRSIPSGYFLEFAGTNEGPGTNPLSGEDSKKARRFQAAIAKNSSGDNDGGVLHWCSARPDDFKAMCSDANGTVFFDGMVEKVHVRVYGDDVGVTPKAASDLTTEITQSAWAK